MLSMVGLANGQILLQELTPYISIYSQGNHDPLIAAINASTQPFMSPTIKGTVSTILTF